MNSPSSIVEGTTSLSGTKPFDVVFLQAGGVTYGKVRRHVEWNGHHVEKTIFQNVFGGHVVIQSLFSLGLLCEGARVVVAGGEGARGIPGMIAKPNFRSAQEFRDYVLCKTPAEPYVEMDAMGVSKFTGAVWSRALAERYVGRLNTVWFTPGFTAGTQGLEGIGVTKQFIFENFAFPVLRLPGIAQSAQQGAEKFAQAVTGHYGKNGDVLGAPEGKTLGKIQDQVPMNPLIDDTNLKNELWAITEELFGPMEERKMPAA